MQPSEDCERRRECRRLVAPEHFRLRILTFEVASTTELGTVSLVRDDAPSAADQAYSACRSGSGGDRGVRPHRDGRALAFQGWKHVATVPRRVRHSANEHDCTKYDLCEPKQQCYSARCPRTRRSNSCGCNLNAATSTPGPNQVCSVEECQTPADRLACRRGRDAVINEQQSHNEK